MSGMPRAILALLLAALIAGVVPHSRAVADPAAPPAASDPAQARAAAHATTLAAAKSAQTVEQAVIKAGQDGPTPEYMNALMDYANLWQGLQSKLDAEAEVEPDVIPAQAAFGQAMARYRAARASPATTDLEMAQADDARAAAWEALEKTRTAAQARVRARLAGEGYDLPEPNSPTLFAKGATATALPDMTPAGVHGFVFTPFTDAPWQVELQWADMDAVKPPLAAVDLHDCGGALIKPDWVLTAAHCVWNRAAGKPYGAASLRVRAGSKMLSDPMWSSAIDEIVLPGGPQAYVVSTAFAPAQNDIALLHLKTPARPRSGGPLAVIAYDRPLRRGEARPQGDVTVSGWGATDTESFGEQSARAVQGGRLRMSPDLRFAPLKLIGNDACAERMAERIRDVYPDAQVGALTGSSLCAGSPDTGTCVGDSGGPLVMHSLAGLPEGDPSARRVRLADRPVLIGIVSWGVGCEDFTVFTRVSSYAAWIDATIAARRKPPPRRPVQRS